MDLWQTALNLQFVYFSYWYHLTSGDGYSPDIPQRRVFEAKIQHLCEQGAYLFRQKYSGTLEASIINI